MWTHAFLKASIYKLRAMTVLTLMPFMKLSRLNVLPGAFMASLSTLPSHNYLAKSLGPGMCTLPKSEIQYSRSWERLLYLRQSAC